MANKQERIASLIQKNITDIIMFELKNPIMRLVSVNSCDVNHDFSLAKVYVSHLDVRKINEAVQDLNAAKGFVRSCLSRKMDTYKVPELVFIKDDTYERAQRIESIIKDINK
jgi:ribosome-binding factor A